MISVVLWKQVRSWQPAGRYLSTYLNMKFPDLADLVIHYVSVYAGWVDLPNLLGIAWTLTAEDYPA